MQYFLVDLTQALLKGGVLCCDLGANLHQERRNKFFGMLLIQTYSERQD